LPIVLGSLKQATGSFSAGLAVCVVLAVLALMTLAVVQSDWIGVWIDKHGRAPATLPLSEREEMKTA
jgi:hypothetical protein